MLMKRVLSCTAACAIALLLSATAASAQVVSMIATLTGGEETPAVLTGAVGTAAVSVDVTNSELSITLSLFNFPTSTTAGHIHVGPRGVAGPVVIDLGIPRVVGDLAFTLRANAARFTARPEIGIITMTDAIQAIVGGNAYINIHTTQFPAGEIRGQLTVAPAAR
jgi:hypothetical protein